jgi:phosphoserine phosphatase RsbU/P
MGQFVAMSEAELRKSLAIHKGLVEVSCLINSIMDHDELLRAILAVARRVMGAEAASIFLVDERSGALRLEMDARGDENYERPGIVLPPGQGIAGWVFEHQKALVIPDAEADARFYKDADKSTGFVTRSLLCAPLGLGGKRLGVIEVLNAIGREGFEESDVEPFTAYADLTATALEKLRSIERLREQERVERDLAIAGDIQRELLGRGVPSRPGFFRFAARNTPAAAVGGDFHGVFPRANGDVDFVVGDVSGKGIPASLLMAQTLSALPFVFDASGGPATALSVLNDKFSEAMIRGMFITVVAGRLRRSSRTASLSSAGHCRPILVRADGAAEFVSVPSSLPVGVVAGTAYDECSVALGEGDRLVFYTDGLAESRGADGEMFEARLLEAAAGPHESPEALLERILEAERRHRGEAPLLDDLTVLAGGFDWRESLVFDGEPAALGLVRGRLRAFLNASGFCEHESARIVLAIDEACTNIIRHAHRGEVKPVRMSMERHGESVEFVLEDRGEPCDPEAIQGRDLGDVRPGGLGVHIIREVFDLVEYTPLEEGTRLRLEKRI